MTGKPTLGTVARAAGVSIPTVSQVLRGTGRISSETRERVLTAARNLHYVRDNRAANMRSGDNREVGFVIHQLQNPFNAEVISGTVDVLELHGYLVSVVDTRDDPERQRRQIEAFVQHGRGGLLWVPATDMNSDLIKFLSAQRIPTVTFLRQAGAELDHVGIRNAEATKMATAHLLQQGHLRVAYLGGCADSQVRRQRISGWQQALRGVGLSPDIVWPCDDNKRAGLDAMIKLRRQHPDVTAVVCNGDMVALGACLALDHLALRAGRDISIVGFDDIQDAAVGIPPLTTMAVRPYQLGQKLAETLLFRIQNPGSPPQVVEVGAELVDRATTGPVVKA